MRLTMHPLLCRTCHTWYTPIHTVPDVCPQCQSEANWTTEPDDPIRPYRLSENDRRLLRSFRIAPE